MRRVLLVASLPAIGLLLLGGCERGAVKVAPAEAPYVPISHPVLREVTEYVDYTGRTNARDSVIIQPRVTGYLVTDDADPTPPSPPSQGGAKGGVGLGGVPFFKEGDFVKKGQILFKIDPRPYKAQLDAAQAALVQNQAGLKYAKETNLLYKEIAKKQPNAVGPRELAQYQAQEEQASANLDLAKANLDAAKLNLEWTVVRSPIHGQISRLYLTPGNLVNQDVTQLTTVVSLDPLYVYFDMDEPTLLRIKTAINEGRSRRPDDETPAMMAASTFGLLGTPLSRGLVLASSLLYPGRHGGDAPVLIALAGESFDPKNRSRQGTIDFIDNQVNPGTGSISVRGVFRNPTPPGGTHLLVPGMFVRVRLPIGEPRQELLVIDRAVTSDQGLKYVYVLDANNVVEARRVTVGALQEDGLRVISSGLRKDDWVVVGGLQQVRPKMVVQRQTLEQMPTLGEAPVPTAEPKTKDKKGAKK